MANVKIAPLHYAFSVQDLDASIAWYEKNMGFEQVVTMYAEGPHSTIAIMKNGDFSLEIFRHDDTLPMNDYEFDPDLHPQHQGVQHMAFEVDDLEALITEMKANGVKILVGPVQMGNQKLYYVADNSGIPIELVQNL